MLSWCYLILAGVFEIGWPLGFKLFAKNGHYAFLILAVVSMAVSGYFLFLAQQKIPIGTAYAVWTGIGAVGTFMVGVFFFGDSALLARWIGVFLILSGVILLKLADTPSEDVGTVSDLSVLPERSAPPLPSDAPASRRSPRSEPASAPSKS